MMRKVVMGVGTIMLISCSPKVTTNLTQTLAPLDYKEEVMVIGIQEQTPSAAVEIGTVKIGDSGF